MVVVVVLVDLLMVVAEVVVVVEDEMLVGGEGWERSKGRRKSRGREGGGTARAAVGKSNYVTTKESIFSGEKHVNAHSLAANLCTNTHA